MTKTQQQVKAILGNHFDTIVQISDIKESLDVSDDKVKFAICAVSGMSMDIVDKLLVAVNLYDQHFKGV
jgi:hypothetical protein